MTNSDIGVQRLLPRTGAAWRRTNAALDRQDNSDGDDAPEAKPDSPPPAPGTGRVVDRIA